MTTAFLIGDAGRHADRLARLLGDGFDVAALPREAAASAAFDDRLHRDDVVVSLRFGRGGGRAPAFRLLHVPGAGLDGIDLAALAPETAVCNVFEHEVPIAEYVLMAMLQWEIRPDRMRFTAETWSDAYRRRIPHGELAGRTVGLFGFGRIGRAVAVRARAFGMRVATLDRSLGDGAALVDVALPAGDLRALARESDYLVVTAPLTAQTRAAVDAGVLRAMKPSAVLVNVSRAELVDEEALYVALRDGVVAGAQLDVWYAYPTGTDDHVAPSRLPLLELPNVVATPHSSAWTDALWERRYRVIADNIRRCAAGRPLLNEVRPARTAASA